MKIYENVEAVPSRLLGLAHLLARWSKDGMSRDDLVAFMQPQGGQSNLAPATIEAAIKVQLVEEYFEKGNKCLKLSEDTSRLKADPDLIHEIFPEIMTHILLRPEAQGECNHSARVCAWLLAQAVTKVPQGHGELKAALEKHGFNLDEFGLRNDARWDVLIYWTQYLGLTWQTRDEKCMGIVPDPTVFILRHIDQLLPSDQEVKASEFRTALGRLCPVLDGGSVRETVLRIMAESGTVQQWPDDQLSSALSFALRRLSRSGHLKYWCPDDHRSFLLMTRGEKIAFLSREKGRD